MANYPFGPVPIAPTGAASGDLTGSYPGPTVATIGGNSAAANMYGFTTADQGLISQTYPVGYIGNSGALLNSGTVYLARLRLPIATTVTNISCAVGSAASALTAAFFGLYGPPSGGVSSLVASTADRHADAAWTAANTIETAPLTSTYAAAAGLYWVALLVTFTTTSPGVGRISVINANVVNVGLSAASGNLAMATYSVTGQTTLPASFTTTSQMVSDNHLWLFGLS